MIHGYHLILPVYGFWLPNDPRGSWSDFVGRWELAKFGHTTHSIDRRELTALSINEQAQRDAARQALKFPPVHLTGQQCRWVGSAFGDASRKGHYTIWACAIMPEHAHLVVARHRYSAEQTANLLKGSATRELLKRELHPFSGQLDARGRVPRMWAERQWKVYLDEEESIENAIRYVEENPAREDKPRQQWTFVTPFAGLAQGGWTTYH